MFGLLNLFSKFFICFIISSFSLYVCSFLIFFNDEENNHIFISLILLLNNISIWVYDFLDLIYTYNFSLFSFLIILL